MTAIRTRLPAFALADPGRTTDLLMKTPCAGRKTLWMTLVAVGLLGTSIACWRRPYSRGSGDQTSLHFTRKVVTGKEEPATLIAVGGAQCIVTKERFDQIRLGEEIWCNWVGARKEPD